jgi:hypothetical protein
VLTRKGKQSKPIPEGDEMAKSQSHPSNTDELPSVSKVQEMLASTREKGSPVISSTDLHFINDNDRRTDVHNIEAAAKKLDLSSSMVTKFSRKYQISLRYMVFIWLISYAFCVFH